uniref:Uncharacterized protein n=1 Tax=Oryza glaberrima TaxID=4538 RepID=I1PF99_ORYGL
MGSYGWIQTEQGSEVLSAFSCTMFSAIQQCIAEFRHRYFGIWTGFSNGMNKNTLAKSLQFTWTAMACTPSGLKTS